jgi:hypothetical protein
MLVLFLLESLINFSCTLSIVKELYKRLVFSSSELSSRLYGISGFLPYVADTQTLDFLYLELKNTKSAHVGLFADFESLFIANDN